MEFYLYARKDFSLLAVKLQGFILKPVVREQEAFGNSHQYRRCGFRLSSSKNILEQREIEEIKKQRAIQKVVVNFRKILTVYFHSITVFLKDKNDRDFYSSYYSLANPLQIFEFDFSSNMKIKKKTLPLYLKIDNAVKLFTRNSAEAFLEVFGFPHFSNPIFFPLDKFEF